MSKNVVVFITRQKENYYFNLTTFDLLTGKEIPQYTQDVHDLLKFFQNPPEFVKTSVKGIVCNILGFVKNGGIDYDFCQKLATKLKNLQIPFRFLPILHIVAMCKFIGAKINPEIDKEILQIYVMEEFFKIVLLSRTDNGYVIKNIRTIPKNYDPSVLLSSSNPTKIILSNAVPFFPSAKIGYLFDGIKELVDHMFDSGSNKYFVIPQCVADIGITNVGINPNENDILLSIKEDEYLPSTKSVIFSRFHKKYYITVKTRTKNTVLQGPVEITKECHQIKLSLTVDCNNFPTINLEAVMLSKVTKMPKRLKIDKTEKLPVIGFFDNLSVICLWNEEENCYKFMNRWNEKYGKNLILDFLLPEPALVASSTSVTSFAGAVYDLIKIMSMPSNDIKINRSWKFTFTKDDENPVLLAFETFEKP